MGLDQRNKRIVFGAGGAIVVVVALVIILAAAGVFKSSDESSGPVILRCESAQCQVQSERLSNYSKLDVNPCEDFEQFTCGNFNASKDSIYSAVQTDEKRLLRDKLNEKLDEILREEDDDDDDYSAIKYVKKAYKECTKEKSDEYTNLLQIYNEIHNTQQNELAVAILTALGESTVIDVDVKPDPFNSSVNVLWLSPPKFGMHPKIYQRVGKKDPTAMTTKEKYVKLMNNSMNSLLNNTERNLTDQILAAIQLESKLAHWALENSRDKVKDSLRNMTIKELQDTMGESGFSILTFLEHLRQKTGNEKVFNYDSQVIVENFLYFGKMATELKKYHRKVTTDYLNMRMIKAFHYLADTNHAVVDMVGQLNQFEEINVTSRCINAIKKSAPMVLGHLYVLNRPLSSEVITNVTDLAKHINSVFQGVINNTDWVTDATDRAVLKRKLQKVKLEVGYPKWIINPKRANNTANLGKPEDKANATVLITEMQKSALKKKLDLIGTNVNESLWQVSPVEVDVSYDHATNTLSVPMAIIQTPFYDNNVTGYLNYAGLGVEVAKNLLKAVGWNGVDFNSNGTMVSPFSGEFLTNHTKKVDCYNDVYKKIKFSDFKAKIDVKRTVDENIADNEALKLAHLAFKNSTFQSDLKLPSESFDKFTDDQLFFISYGSSRCHYVSSKLLYTQVVAGEAAPLTNRTSVSLSNYKNFTESLNCEKGSNYAPEKSCSIWF